MAQHHTCSRCGDTIADQTLVRVGDLVLHEACLTCDICAADLAATSRCYAKYGALYCREDYLKMFGPKCHVCRNAFKQSEEIRTVGGPASSTQFQFHLGCFQCSVCQLGLLMIIWMTPAQVRAEWLNKHKRWAIAPKICIN